MNILRAHALEPADFIPLYHIAHCYSILRQVKKYLNSIKLISLMNDLFR